MSLAWLTEAYQYNAPSEVLFDSNKRCRTCLTESQYTSSLEKVISFDEYGTKLTLVQLVQECASVEIPLGDAKPQTLCRTCIDSVSHFYMFRKRCQLSQAVLAQEFKTENAIKEEVFEPQYSDETSHMYRNKRKYKRRKLKREDVQDSLSQGCVNLVEVRIQEVFQDIAPLIDDGFSSDEDDEPLSVLSKKHKAQILSDEFNTKCDMCNKKLKTHIALVRHKKRHERRYMETLKAKTKREQRRPADERSCEYCGKVYKYRHYMLKHVQRTHAKVNPELKNPPRKLKKSVEDRTCDVCGKTYVDRKVMLTHKRRFHFKKDRDITFKSEFNTIEGNVDSNQQSQIESDQTQLQQPIQAGALFCAYCDWTGSLGDLVKHRIAEHSHLKEWKCDHCGKMFFTKASKEVHQLVHTGEKQHVCELCGGSFAIKSNLERHRRTHTGEKPYKCTRCDKSFAQSSALILHGQTHTKDRKFVCNVCGKSYHLQSTLRVHMKKHQPVDQWLKCSMCEKRFSDRKFLRQHMVVHTGERNHKCPICDKGFGRESSMRTHMKIHTGDKTSTSAAAATTGPNRQSAFTQRSNYYPNAVAAAVANNPALQESISM